MNSDKSEVPKELLAGLKEREAEANNYAFPPCAGCGGRKSGR